MLNIEKTKVDQHIILTLDGEVDASNSVELDMAIQQLLADRVSKILIDGSSLEYISSAGLGVFMSYLEDFEKTGVRFVIYGLNTKVKNVFHILGLDQLLAIKDSEQGALEVLYEE
ncbi:MAG TPA: STAS domain-containing protein [Cyclobacteriaceae bacterium]|nr:STAS domain-containing protein [Cyclobacteriaceae bacterium]